MEVKVDKRAQNKKKLSLALRQNLLRRKAAFEDSSCDLGEGEDSSGSELDTVNSSLCDDNKKSETKIN